MKLRKQPSKEALQKGIAALVPYIVEMIKEDKRKKEPPTQ
jgi:hypothetical protein